MMSTYNNLTMANPAMAHRGGGAWPDCPPPLGSATVCDPTTVLNERMFSLQASTFRYRRFKVTSLQFNKLLIILLNVFHCILSSTSPISICFYSILMCVCVCVFNFCGEFHANGRT